MGELRRKLAYLKETKAAIKAALVEGGQEVKETDTFRSYADKIRAFQPVLEGLEVTENGEYTPPEGVDGFSGVNVAVPVPTLFENMEVPLDFSNGDMRIEAPNGTAVKSAIIQKPDTLIPENIAKDVEIAGIVGTHEGGGGSSDGDTTLKDLVEGTIVSLTLPADVTKIRYSAFAQLPVLSTFNAHNVTSIANNAFNSCPKLASVNMPNLVSISSRGFYGCEALTGIDLTNVTSIGGQAFHGCEALTGIDLTNVTSIDSNAFEGCKALTGIDMPKITKIGSGTFAICSSLLSVNMPNVTSIGTQAFYDCKALTRVRLPATPPTLSNVNAFQNVPTTCVFSIPTGSLTEYQNATNWSSLTSTYSFVEEDR